MYHREEEHEVALQEQAAGDISRNIDFETCGSDGVNERCKVGLASVSCSPSACALGLSDNGELTNGRGGLSKKSNSLGKQHNRQVSTAGGQRQHHSIPSSNMSEGVAVVGEGESPSLVMMDMAQLEAHDDLHNDPERTDDAPVSLFDPVGDENLSANPSSMSLGGTKGSSQRERPHDVADDGRGVAGSQEPCGCDVASTSPVSVTLGSPPSASASSSAAARKQDSPKHFDPELSSRQKCKRSKSYERKLNEAMMFSAAVGEKPPLSNEEITREIVEEDSSSDDEDDANIELQDDASVEASALKAAADKFDQQNGSDEAKGSGDRLAEGEGYASTPYLSEGRAFDARDLSELERPSGRSPRGAESLGLCVRHTTTHALLRCMLDEFETFGSRQQQQDFFYRGIVANPPEVTVRGMSRGNRAQLHRKAWLEVSDVPKHRYGKNLRKYYKHWESLSHPTNMFFDWLDSKGEATGQPLPDLPECPRSELDSDTVLYITEPLDREKYAFQMTLCDSTDDSGKSVKCAKVLLPDGSPVSTGSEGWIFVLRDNVMYGAEKVTSINGSFKQRFHHSTFFGGKAVAAAGILVTKDDGCLTRLYPHSGHYRPGEAHTQRMLRFLQDIGVDLSTFEVDTQQIMYISRELKDTAPKGVGNMDAEAQVPKKSKKMNTLHMKSALSVACFLSHKAILLKNGLFSQIDQKGGMDPEIPVQDFLDCVDAGGWKKVASCKGKNPTTTRGP